MKRWLISLSFAILVGILSYSEGWYNAFEQMAQARGRVGIVAVIQHPNGNFLLEGDPKIVNRIQGLVGLLYDLGPKKYVFQENQILCRYDDFDSLSGAVTTVTILDNLTSSLP